MQLGGQTSVLKCVINSDKMVPIHTRRETAIGKGFNCYVEVGTIFIKLGFMLIIHNEKSLRKGKTLSFGVQ